MGGKNKKDFRASKLGHFTLVIFLLCIFGGIYLIHSLKSSEWNSFTAHGGVYGKILKKDDSIIFGTDLYKLFVANTRKANDYKIVELNGGTVFPQEIDENYAYVISGDTFWKINIKNGTPEWHFSSDNQFAFDTSKQSSDGYIYISARDGSLYALSKKDGKAIWKHTGEISDVAPSFKLENSTIYLANGRDIFSINRKNGKINWTTVLDDHVGGNITILNKKVILFKQQGGIVSLDGGTGKVGWQVESNKDVLCNGIYKSNLVKITSSGEILYIDGRSGKTIWTSESIHGSINCPAVFSNDGILSTYEGLVFRVDFKNGKTMWIKDGFGKITLSPLIYSSGLFRKDYLVTDLDGKLWSISSNSKTNWIFDTSSPIYSPPLVSGDKIFVATSVSEIYKLDRFTGMPNKDLKFAKFSTKHSSRTVGENEIFEISLNSKSDFTNPWSEGALSATFTGPSGRVLNVDGFYYDQKTWKLRFNPPEKGLWKYTLNWNDHGAIYSRKGILTSRTDTSNSYLKIAKANPKRLTLDGVSIFNGVGIESVMVDFNGDGSPLDDWYIGDEVDPQSSTSSVNTVSKTVSLDRFINEYGPNGAGFNIYRHGNMNGNDSIYNELGEPTVYSVSNGKTLDTLMEKLRGNNIHVWYSFFHFVVPYYDSLNPTNEKILSSYIRYIIARYGAYVDIWELVNEYQVPESMKTFLIKEIKKYDFESRPITISPEDTGTLGIDIISPHWYQTEKLSDSDKVTADYIDRFASVPKPVIFGEQGNASSNWDGTSAERMRVRLWTAFFHQGTLVLWSSSSSKNEYQGLPYFYSNIYLGSIERLYVKHLQIFTNSIALDNLPMTFSLGEYGIRGYGLSSNNQFSGYFFNYAATGRPTQFSYTFRLPKEGAIEWYDPKSGNIIEKGICSTSVCTLSSPKFVTDIALRWNDSKGK